MKKWFMIGLVIAVSIAGMACKDSMTPPPPSAPTIHSFTANPTTIHTGGSATLAWNVSNATSLTIDNGVGAVTGASGTKSVSPTQTTTYTLTATNATGTKTATATVTLQLVPPVVTSFTATPASIMEGGTSTLAWTVTGATTITIDQGIGAVAATGTTDVTPGATTTYTLTATNADGTTTATAQVEIKARAVLTIATSPDPVVWTYDADEDTTSGTFSEVITDTNGVAGHVYSAYTGLYLTADPGSIIAAVNWGSGDFAANGSVTLGPNTISGEGQATIFAIIVDGTDANGYDFAVPYYGTITWSGAMGTVYLQQAVPGLTDPKIMRLFDDMKTRKR
jgi:hypothetical protein